MLVVHPPGVGEGFKPSRHGGIATTGPALPKAVGSEANYETLPASWTLALSSAPFQGGRYSLTSRCSMSGRRLEDWQADERDRRNRVQTNHPGPPTRRGPRERLKHYGAKNLSNTELIAILLRTGLKGENVLSLSSRVLAQTDGLSGLSRSTFGELCALKGLSEAKVCHLMASLELGRRLVSLSPDERAPITAPPRCSQPGYRGDGAAGPRAPQGDVAQHQDRGAQHPRDLCWKRKHLGHPTIRNHPPGSTG